MTTTLMAKLAFVSLALMTVLNSMAQTGKLQEEKELEVVNFKSIKKVLEQDGLSKEAQDKKKQVVEMKKVQNVVEASRYMYPTQEEMWSFLSEYWLIKNAQIHANFETYDGKEKGLIDKLNLDGNPMFLLFGTGWGLTASVTEQADFRLEPIFGIANDGYNHLSVRSAVAIYCDRLARSL